MFEKNPGLRVMALVLLGGSAIALSACQTTTAKNSPRNHVDAVLDQAASNAAASGQTRESLAIVEKLYKRNPNDADIATRYARALREDNRLTRASLIIAPFAKDTRKPHAGARAEYAAVQAALGNYEIAEEFSRKALALSDKTSQSWHILGISLDAQGKHPEAEDAFRKALELWEGDPAPVLNNLGLNLAAQGFLDEAAETLRKALDTAPNREEIERNLRIVSALRESGGRAPSYVQEARDKKNGAKKTASAEPVVLGDKDASAGANSPAPLPKQKPETN
ncbi:MAG: tetratricopeptide repeat protein [Micavibrio aeruginosavorus]|nr:tetratricopeptide repeat protein [Micavibrio aeruginosavorus]